MNEEEEVENEITREKWEREESGNKRKVGTIGKWEREKSGNERKVGTREKWEREKSGNKKMYIPK